MVTNSQSSRGGRRSVSTTPSAPPLTGVQLTGALTRSEPGLARAARAVTAHLAWLGAAERAAGDTAESRWQLAAPHGEIHGTVGGWDPQRDGPFDEVCAQAAYGVMAVHGRARGRPRPLGVEYISVTAASLLVQGMLAGALGRLRGIPVTRVEVGLPAAALITIGQYIAAATTTEDPQCGQPRQPEGAIPPPFRCADGVWFELESMGAQPWQEFWRRLDVPERDIERSWRSFGLRYPAAVGALAPTLHEATRRWDFPSIERFAAGHGMSLMRMRSLADRRRDPDRNDPHRSAAGGQPSPWRFAAPEQSAPASALPASARRPASHGTTLPLDGLAVVESCRRVQGPLAGHLLQLLGASVVRIEPPGGDPLRGMPPIAGDCSARFIALNHDKNVVEIDITSSAGRRAVLELAASANVFVHNWAPGKAASLRLDADDLHAVNPSLVYAYASGWGTALGADPPPGVDFMVQAYSGIGELVGDQGAPRPSLMTLLDVLGAHICVEGILAALVDRARSRHGQRVDSSLLGAADALLAEELGYAPADRSGCGYAAPPPLLARVFDTADEPLAVSVRSSATLAGLCRSLGEPVPEPADVATGFARRLGAILATAPALTWRDALHTDGVPAAVVQRDLAALAADPRLARCFADHGCAVVTTPWRFS